jgi:hypothetical protein
MVFPPFRWNTGPRFADAGHGAGEKLEKKPGTPYTKKALRQTANRITSGECGNSGLAAGLFYAWIMRIERNGKRKSGNRRNFAAAGGTIC